MEKNVVIHYINPIYHIIAQDDKNPLRERGRLVVACLHGNTSSRLQERRLAVLPCKVVIGRSFCIFNPVFYINP